MISWYGILLAVLILDGIFLGVVVLLQSGKGGGLAAMGGGAAATDGILGGRQATTMLTRATWTTGSVFMLLSLVLSIMSSRTQVAQSILRQDTAPVLEAGQSILQGLLDEGDAGDGSGEPIEAPPAGDGND
ncbi:MAG: preprotein translocase subunit SecG [Gemmatimonadetes bacterium]|jgi:preprotein translocase subunit SecG|nr:preprotein translocase subunit SecG [Gemmatimonadota bacterium]MCH8810568.1 preprotein translocase subunit SecG [Gemmatimonadota bacterium]